MLSETVGQRVFMVRRDLGDGWKNPLSQADFAALLSRQSGRAYDSAMVSRIENGDRKVSLDEVACIAALDPKKRGREWLAWGEQTPAVVQPDPALDYKLTDEEVNDAVAAEEARTRPAQKKAGNGHRRQP